MSQALPINDLGQRWLHLRQQQGSTRPRTDAGPEAPTQHCNREWHFPIFRTFSRFIYPSQPAKFQTDHRNGGGGGRGKMARCHRNCEFCAETSGITETGRAPIRDHRDTTNEEPRTLSFMIKAASPHRCARCVAPALALAPGHLSALPLPPMISRTPNTRSPNLQYLKTPGVGHLNPRPKTSTRAPNACYGTAGVKGVTKGSERTSARAPSHHLQVKYPHGRIYRTNLYNCGLWAPTTRYHGSQSNYAYLKRNASQGTLSGVSNE